MKNIFLYIKVFVLFLFLAFNVSFAQQDDEKNYEDIIQNGFALYATQNYDDAYNILNNLPTAEKNKEVYLILSNIAREKNLDNQAVSYLNKALDIDYSYYKAYYNLGCIFASKGSYLLASNNFELANQYNKTFAPAYYNLACCQMKLKNFKGAKKNLIKALELDSQNKDILYNLAYCYKELNQTKKAQKVLEQYNKLK